MHVMLVTRPSVMESTSADLFATMVLLAAHSLFEYV